MENVKTGSVDSVRSVFHHSVHMNLSLPFLRRTLFVHQSWC